MTTHIFIDANIFLNFYRYSNDDLNELGKISTLIESGKVILYLPDQVIFEFNRNRDSVIAESYKKFLDLKFDQAFPYICKTYDEYKQMRESIKKFNETKKALEEKLINDIKTNSLKADEVVRELFNIGNRIESTDEIVDKAVLRYKRGNPPGKDGSYGDAINWEVLLVSVPESEELCIISDDKDFKSPIDNSQFSSFLQQEWEEKKKSKINFYNQLSNFFAENYPEIKLKEEENKNSLIADLMTSLNFASTHGIISKLKGYADFSPSQIRQLIDAAVINNQVYWIAEDPDVNTFYKKLIEGKSDLIDQETFKTFAHYFFDDKTEESAVESNITINADEIPF